MTITLPPAAVPAVLRVADAAFGRPVRAGAVSWHSALLYVALAAAGIALAIFRIPPASWSVLWAEDAGVFLEQAYRHPLSETIVTGYAGYSHLVPRLIAAATAAWVPIDAVPVVTTVIMAVLTSALGLAVFFLSRAHLATLPARLLGWLLVVAAPVAALEIALNSANFQWYVLLGAFWAIFARRPLTRATWIASALLLLAVGSSALALLFVPFAIWRAARFRKVHDIVPAAVAALTSVFQVTVILNSVRERPGHGLNPLHFAGNYAVEVVGGAWMAPRVVLGAYELAPVLCTVAAVALTALTWVMAWRIRRTTPLGLLGLVIGVVYLVPVMWLTSFAGPYLAGWYSPSVVGSRYAFLAVSLVGLVIVATVDDLLVRLPPRSRRDIGLATTLIVIQLIAVVIGYRGGDPRQVFLAGIPSWEQSLEDARASCAERPSEDVYLRGSADSPAEWDSLLVACRVVLAR